MLQTKRALLINKSTGKPLESEARAGRACVGSVFLVEEEVEVIALDHLVGGVDLLLGVPALFGEENAVLKRGQGILAELFAVIPRELDGDVFNDFAGLGFDVRVRHDLFSQKKEALLFLGSAV